MSAMTKVQTHLLVGFGRIVVSEGEAPNLFVTLVYHWLRVAAKR
jgi:hypothetical protein